MSEKYKTTDKDKAYFVTFTIVEWLNVMQEDNYKMIIVNSIKHCQENRGITLFAYCIMSNHVHLIIQSNGKESVSDVLRDLKKHTSKEISKRLETDDSQATQKMLAIFKNEGTRLKRIKKCKVWQDGNRPMALYSNKFIWQKLDYIHYNAVKAGIVQNPEEYMYSSARNYAELSSVLEIVMLTREWKTVK